MLEREFPGKELGACHIIFLARDLKTKQESFKMRFKGDKIENVQMKL